MSKKALIILADGFEETEAMATLDVLRRAGIDVTLAGLYGTEVTGAHAAKVFADTTLEKANGEYAALILPGGGKGAENLSRSERVKDLITTMHEKKKIVAAICASPAVVLAPTGVLEGKKAICYPGMEKAFSSGTRVVDEPVVVDGNIVTSKGPGTALLFGIKLAELLAGKDIAESVKKNMLV